MAYRLKKGISMKKLTMILACSLLLASCSQMTTNKRELAALKTTADNFADAYVGCVVKVSLKNTSKNAIDVATAVQLAGTVCQPELDQFTGSQEEYLSSQFMVTEKPLQESVDALNERATIEVGEALLAAADNQPSIAAPVVAGSAAAAVAASPSTATSLSSAPATDGWTADQRVYLDCMEDQGRKYSELNESATVIADVAQSRCQSYMNGSGAADLQQEGRALVMGVVLDAKLQGPGRQPTN
jgi:hypothetical protein